MEKLFISFSRLLRKLRDNVITSEDLGLGLFYFGCTRDYAIDPQGINPECNDFKNVFGDNDNPEGMLVLEQIRKAILHAENEGRCLWRTASERNTYDKLNELLVANGYCPIADCDGRTINDWYCYPGVQDRVKEKGLELEVVR